MLLPLPVATLRSMSLRFHLALAACREQGNGNSYQFNELLRALYIAYYLQGMAFGFLPPNVFACAEFGMNQALAKGKSEQAWQVDSRTASLLEQILALHDVQLNSIRYKDLTAATEQLERFIVSQRASPLPDECRAEAKRHAADALRSECARTQPGSDNS